MLGVRIFGSPNTTRNRTLRYQPRLGGQGLSPVLGVDGNPYWIGGHREHQRGYEYMVREGGI